MLSHKNAFGLIQRPNDIDDECNCSELNRREMKQMMYKRVIRDHEEARKINDAQIPDMEKVL